MADYRCHPLWWDGGDRVGDIDPRTLGLPDELTAALAAWAARYDAILNLDDPARSAFHSPQAEAAFDADGRALARRLGQALGDGVSVRYWRDPA